MRLLRAAVVMVLLTAPAYAQSPHVNLIPEVRTKTPEEKEQEAIRDRAYRDSLRKIPDAKASNDPWGTVRSSGTAKASGSKASGSKASGSKASGSKAAPRAKRKTVSGNSAQRSQ